MAYAIDPIYDDPTAEYANDEPIGGTGNEATPNRRGFFYAGPVAGEAPAREAWNAGAPAGPPEALDLGGNAYARNEALTYAAAKAQADAQRDIESSYLEAKTAQQLAAVHSAEEYARRRAVQQDLDRGISPGEAFLRNLPGHGGTGMGAAMNALRDHTPHLQDFGEGVGKAIVTGTGQVKFPPIQVQTAKGIVEGEPIIDKTTGQPIPNKVSVRGERGGIHILDISPPGNPADKLRLSGEVANPDSRLAPTRYSGPLSAVQDRFGTNLPPQFQRPPTIGDSGELSIGGIVPGRVQAGNISMQSPTAALTAAPAASTQQAPARGGPAEKQYDSLADAKKGGAKSGDIILLWNPSKNKYAKFRVD